MDNLPAHKVEGVRKLIADAGAELRLLPAYRSSRRLRNGRLDDGRARLP
jgi:hypothetical protein